MKVVALAGGVGGAKMVDGLAQSLPPDDLVVIVNTGDDFEHLGLKICPDLDTVCYTLAGIANHKTGWGRAEETWNALENFIALGGPDWFRLGDKDLGTHLERTRLLQEGFTLSQVTERFCKAWGINPRVLPMSDNQISTIVCSDQGELPFQEYFVRLQCQPRVNGFQFIGIEEAEPSGGVMESIQQTDLVVICPSNPWVSIDPILSMQGVVDGLKSKPVIAISPIIGGRAVKGPAAKMFVELGILPSPLAVAGHYGSKRDKGILDGLVMDKVDEGFKNDVSELGLKIQVTETIIYSPSTRRQLAQNVLLFGKELIESLY
jgi:LPPG:FO 2-phospho-L-lactate transferase